MLVPYSTDAPIYHYPIATVSLIVINVLFFIGWGGSPMDEQDTRFRDREGREYSVWEVDEEFNRRLDDGEDVDAFVESLRPIRDSIRDKLLLTFGDGFHPLQWLTAMFMHADIMHLIGNMIFLWSFGLVVEGKLGNVVFPLLYLAMGIVQAIAVQMLMFFSDGAALGASGAIFSLLALVVIFAPVNCFEVFVILGFRFFTFEISILAFGGLYLAMNTFFFFLGGATMSSELLHLIGFLVGLPVGFVLLTQGLVDCEGFDLISYMTSTTGKESKVGKKPRSSRVKAKEQVAVAETQAVSLANKQRVEAQLVEAVNNQQWDAAVSLQRHLVREYPGTGWNPQHLMAIVKGMLAKREYDKAASLIEAQIEASDVNRFNWQCNLLRIWLQQNRPRHAIRYMQNFNLAFLSDDEQKKLQQLASHAKQQIKSGVHELQ